MGMRKVFKMWCVVTGLLSPFYFAVAGCFVGSFYSAWWGWMVGLGSLPFTVPLFVLTMNGVMPWVDYKKGWLYEWYEKEPRAENKAPKVIESGSWRG